MTIWLQLALFCSLLTLTAVAALIWAQRRVGSVPYLGLVAVALLFAAEMVDHYANEGTMRRPKTVAKAPPVSADAALARASALFKESKYSEARDAYRAAANVGADPILCAHAVADCDFNLRDDKQLVADCALLHELPGGEGRARFWIGQMHRRNKNRDAAQSNLEMAVRHGYLVANGALERLAKEKW